MRYLGLAAVGLLAACGGGESANKAKGAAASLEPGQYEVTAQVTQFRKADEGVPKMKAEPGSRTTRSVCVTDGASLPPELFADEGFTCRNGTSNYVRAGRINANVSCTRPDLKGDLGYVMTGTFEAQSFRAERQFSTALATDGDVVIASTLEGRRTGACTAPAEPGAGNKAK
jgi:hypothetical protein